jgi:hypothetical protein
VAVNIIWQYQDASHVGGEDQDLGNLSAGSESSILTLAGHFETDLGISRLTGVGFYLGPYDGVYVGDHDSITDYNDVISWGNIRPIPLLVPDEDEGSTSTSTTTTTTTTTTTAEPLPQRGFLINQFPGTPDWGWQACRSEAGSNPDNAFTLRKEACTPEADEHGLLELGSTMTIRVKVSLPAIVDNLGHRQVSLYTVYSYTS